MLAAAATVPLMIGGCRRPPTYDPAEDPLVNPPSMLASPPSDLSQIATDETLYLQLEAVPIRSILFSAVQLTR